MFNIKRKLVNNMKLCFPVNFVGITNGYSKSHQAIDLGWHDKQDEPIFACADGVITKIYQDEEFGGGLTLSIDYVNGYSSDFKHLSKTLVNVGDVVRQFDQVAIMGNTGWASKGTHLHFNLYDYGKRVNPLEHTYLYPNQEVHKEDKEKILYYKGETMKFKKDDKVVINGDLYKGSNDTKPSGKVTNKVTNITRVVEGSKHPYNTTGDLGWMDEEDITLYEEPITGYKELYEKQLLVNKDLQAQIELLQNKINKAIDDLK